MTDPRDDAFLYPNRDEGSPPLSRRQLLAGSAAAGAAVTAGCAGEGADGTDTPDGISPTAAVTDTETDAETATESGTDTATETPTPTGPEVTGAETVYVFNTGEDTVSLIDVADASVVATVPVGFTSSFPSNQYTPGLVREAGDVFWLNVGRGVRAMTVGSLTSVTAVETGSGANWQEVTPDGSALVVSAREPAHRQVRIDADPTSNGFGEVTGEIDRTSEGGTGDREGPGPCDVSIHPDSTYAYVPDLFGDTLTTIDVEAFTVETQTTVETATDAANSRPWMGTVAPDGETLLVEHNEGAGSESIWDLSDPAAPELQGRLTTADDDLGRRPLTSEIGPDSATGYVFTPGSNGVTVVDLDAGTVTDRLDVGGSAFTGTWGPGRERLYVPVQTANEVAVIDHAAGEVTATVPVGAEPYGATAAPVRPTEETLAERPTPEASLVDRLTSETTSYCIGECACGHEL
jgi:YVTN family beta-propeller protein